MSDVRMKRAAVATTVVGVSAALALVGCSSSSGGGSSTTSAAPEPTKTSEAPKPSGAINPPAGSTKLSSQNESGGVVYTRYSTSQSPTAVTTFYKGEMSKDGWKVTSSGSGGGGWGQYGGSGSQVEGNDGTTFVAVNAGGSKQGPTYFEVCEGPSSSAVDNCQDNDHGDSNNS